MKRLRRSWDAFWDFWCDPKCRVCGERLPAASYEAHWRLQHQDDWCAPGRAA